MADSDKRERALHELMEAAQKDSPSKYCAAVLRKYEECEFYKDLLAKARTLLALQELHRLGELGSPAGGERP